MEFAFGVSQFVLDQMSKTYILLPFLTAFKTFFCLLDIWSQGKKSGTSSFASSPSH